MPKGIKGFQKGHQTSKETRKKISENTSKGRLERKKRLGYLNSPETREKLRRYKGSLASNWRGGISFEPYTIDWTKALKRSIRERDKYTCQICGKEPAIDCHHIDYDKKNCNSDNLIILCRSCHMRTNINRNYWINYFRN